MRVLEFLCKGCKRAVALREAPTTAMENRTFYTKTRFSFECWCGHNDSYVPGDLRLEHLKFDMTQEEFAAAESRMKPAGESRVGVARTGEGTVKLLVEPDGLIDDKKAKQMSWEDAEARLQKAGFPASEIEKVKWQANNTSGYSEPHELTAEQYNALVR